MNKISAISAKKFVPESEPNLQRCCPGYARSHHCRHRPPSPNPTRHLRSQDSRLFSHSDHLVKPFPMDNRSPLPNARSNTVGESGYRSMVAGNLDPEKYMIGFCLKSLGVGYTPLPIHGCIWVPHPTNIAAYNPQNSNSHHPETPRSPSPKPLPPDNRSPSPDARSPQSARTHPKAESQRAMGRLQHRS
jgi:hypothetical protein